ncbi:hypothetical protein [Caballeronia sp. BR00000012568055]|uniref:hypothetical protein n=1 Tax=Caballeronia sp. BR00000012568055 TaxID=2918761 RepID=UPI0023F7719F|nr:hypothetical protein [Caballeronia sp. BR00000012568055]
MIDFPTTSKRVFSLSSLVSTAVSRLDKLRIFDAKDYLNLNPDVASAGVPAAEHAFYHGANEGRPLFSRARLARALGELVTEDAFNGAVFGTNQRGVEPALTAVNIYVSSLGNVFMNEIAGDLAADLRHAGINVVMLNETADIDTSRVPAVFVAPHEFFALGRGKRWMRDEIIANAFVYNTEQLQTQWFARALPVLMCARGILDISSFSARIFREAGIPSMHVEPSCGSRHVKGTEADRLHPLMRVLPEAARDMDATFDDWDARPIDVSFFGTESPRRESILARFAASLAPYSTCIYYRRKALSSSDRSPFDAAMTRIAEHVSGCSKIYLNIHRDEFSYFEWHRMVRQGMARGALVVTDPCLPHPYFKPGIHFLEEEARHIPNLLDWVLRSEDGRAKAKQLVQNALTTALSTNVQLERTRSVVDFLAAHQKKAFNA